MSDIQSRVLTTKAGELHYLEAGRSGPQVVLLHGKAFQATTWEETGTLAYLAAGGYHCFALDMPGFGRSPASDAGFPAALQGLLDGCAINRPVLVGPSMGGAIALEYVLAEPDALSGLVLVGAVRVVENEERLNSIQVPVLLIWGSEDTISPLSNADILERELPHCSKRIFDGAPHPCYLDQPDRFNAALDEFLGGLPV